MSSDLMFSAVGMVATAVAAAAGALWFIELLRSVLRSMQARSLREKESDLPALAGYLAAKQVETSLPLRAAGYVLTMIRPITALLGPILPVRFREFAQHQLRQAGLDEFMTAQDLWGIALLCPFTLGLFISTLGLPAGIVLLAIVLSALLPWMWIRDLGVRQRMEVARQLPAFVDMLTLALEAGGALSVALRVATDRASDGALRRAFLRVQADIRSGRSRIEALQALGSRLNDPAVLSLVAALIQAESGGASLAGVLRIQSEQRLAERFTRAEKMALEAPVKMLGPLVLCIFPCTFLVLAFPVLARFL